MESSADVNTFSLTILDQKFGNIFQQPSTSVVSNNFEANELPLNVISPSKQRRNSSATDMTHDKQIIVDHPLYPLVEYFFIKCEEATQILGGGFIHTPDVEAILKKQLEIHGSLSSKDSDINFLLLNTIQHLRYQHHELQKVDELCQHFRERYLGCLKTKITHETLLGWSDGDSDSCSPPEPLNPNASTAPVATIQTPTGSISVTLFDNQTPRDHHRDVKPATDLLKTKIPMSASLPLLISAPNNVSDSACLLLTSAPSNTICSTATIASFQYSLINNMTNLSSVAFDMDSGDNGETGSSNSNGKPKRGSLPRRSVDLLRSWLFQHIVHPYPSEDEKRHLSKETGLNLIQVNNWFINARRRILQPLLDGNERSSSPNSPDILPTIGKSFSPNLKRNVKSSKCKSTSSSTSHVATKHWPEAAVSNHITQENDDGRHENSTVERSKKRRKKRKTLESFDFSDHETSDDDSTVDGFSDEKHKKIV